MNTDIMFEVTQINGMSRPLIREPDLINRWKSGDHGKAECLSDNKCFGPAMAGKGISCVMKRRGDGDGS